MKMNKAQMTEAVLFFSEQGVCKEMLFPEFEALLDNMVNMPEFADQQMRLAYVLINPRLLVRAIVFFYLDFDERGAADPGWNLPLRHLADTSGRGPDLGAGPIRLACRSQCPVSWHQMHLWDPSLVPGKNDLAIVRDTVKRNGLGLLVEEPEPLVLTERLQMAAEEQWQASDPLREQGRQQARADEQAQRLKTAQLIKQLRLRVSSQHQQYEQELAQLKLAASQRQQQWLAEYEAARQALARQEGLNASLKAQLHEQARGLQQTRGELTRQLQELEQQSHAAAEILRQQFDAELQARLASAQAELREQLQVRDMELAYSADLQEQLRSERDTLLRERDTLAAQSGEQVLTRLAEQGVVFVAFHPGAGHLTISLGDMARYQTNPLAYAAEKCFVSEAQYRQWLTHYQAPRCEALLPTGERCNEPLPRVEMPGRFASGDSNCCPRHKNSHRHAS